jgi:hypothetical protein
MHVWETAYTTMQTAHSVPGTRQRPVAGRTVRACALHPPQAWHLTWSAFLGGDGGR